MLRYLRLVLLALAVRSLLQLSSTLTSDILPLLKEILYEVKLLRNNYQQQQHATQQSAVEQQQQSATLSASVNSNTDRRPPAQLSPKQLGQHRYQLPSSLFSTSLNSADGVLDHQQPSTAAAVAVQRPPPEMSNGSIIDLQSTASTAAPVPSSSFSFNSSTRDVSSFLAEQEALRDVKLSLLKRMKPLRGITSPKVLTQLADSLVFQSYEPGQTIIRQGDYGDTMYFVASGGVNCFVDSQIVHSFSDGNYFGEVALLYGSVRTASCVASVFTEVFMLQREPFLAMLEAEGSVRRVFEKEHITREEESVYKTQDRLRPDVRTKILSNIERRMKEFDTRMSNANGDATKKSELTWQVRDTLGSGAYGVVYSAVSLTDGKPLAVKQINTSSVMCHGSGGCGKSVEKAFLRQVRQESELLQRLSHPNIVKGFGIQTDEENAYVLMELLPNGSLEDLLKDCGPLSESAARHYTEQLLRGLLYLHGEGVLHRDIKPANLLLSESGDVKLADFGISKLSLGAHNTKTNTLAGTPAYLSPEAISGRYSIASDVWAVGCTVLQLVTGRMPWSEKKFETATQLIFHVATSGAHPDLPATDIKAPQSSTEVHDGTITAELEDFLATTMHAEATNRGNVATFLDHPWIKATTLPTHPAFLPPAGVGLTSADSSRAAFGNPDYDDISGTFVPRDESWQKTC